MPENDVKTMNFEKEIEALEALVSRMEKGDMPLEEAFSSYEEGMTMLKNLRRQLESGQRRITELTEQGETPFEEDEA